ncbi:MAG: DEAD/DEAH box helicase [Pseudomonadota bacterium]
MALERFHPAIAAWFKQALGPPTQVQSQAWDALAGAERRHLLVAAPTGSGKTLAAFLSAIDGLLRESLALDLPDECRVLYVSPLKALSNDVRKNLQHPLLGIDEQLAGQLAGGAGIRAAVRTGDTPQADRQRMSRQPPHILVTTPESLYLLLTGESGRRLLRPVRTVIVDEIHSLVPNKRGAHLAVSLERLARVTAQPFTRIGLSATQKPIEEVARYLVGNRREPCTIVDAGHARAMDLALELPPSPLATIMANEVFEEVYDRLAELIQTHRTTLIFVNTRRLCERAARHLADRLGEPAVTSHHGSLARVQRLAAEQRLKAGELRALVATASLELGIDVGEVDLVCQLGSPRRIATFLQRVGRSGHAVRATPKGRLFPLSTDELVESVALLNAVRAGELDALESLAPPLDVLAQQVVAEVAAGDCTEDELYACVCAAWPFRTVRREDFDAVVRMLGRGFITRRGRRGAHLHHDAVGGVLRARRGARLYALTNGGTIPDQFDYDVMLLPEETRIGTLGEDFAFESVPGDVFQLGNASYRVIRSVEGKVYVEDAHGAPPSIPFWFGEAPARSHELSQYVGDLRAQVERWLLGGSEAAAVEQAAALWALDRAAAQQLIDFLAGTHAALGALPVAKRLVLERFFDDSGDMHLVLHTGLGARLNRAWGLALRKRFCRKFNFELQAAALEESLVLSLGPTHSFALDEVVRYVHPDEARRVLVQALLDAPMFPARWRWCATTALAIRRTSNGRRVPAQVQRNEAEDLIALVFPDQLACLENLSGPRDVPDHPLVTQAVDDCLHEHMDITRLEGVLREVFDGEFEIVTRDTAAPSPMAQAVVAARPYAFLDDAPAEERRTRAVSARPRGLGANAVPPQLDATIVARVANERAPRLRDAEEVHDALLVHAYLVPSDGAAGESPAHAARVEVWMGELMAAGRATCFTPPGGHDLWVAAERLGEFQAVFSAGCVAPSIEALSLLDEELSDPGRALREIVRGRLELAGPVSAGELAEALGLTVEAIALPLLALEGEGFVIRGHFPPAPGERWCERRALARMQRECTRAQRARVEPASPAQFMQFLMRWHGLAGVEGRGGTGVDGVAAVLTRLEGYAAPAGALEPRLLADRVHAYQPELLDQLCAAGRYTWLRPPRSAGEALRRPVRHTAIALVARKHLRAWRLFAATPEPLPTGDEEAAVVVRAVHAALRCEGALFFDDLVDATELPAHKVHRALARLVAGGLASSDTFAGLRALLRPMARPNGERAARAGRQGVSRQASRTQRALVDAGRWSLLRHPGGPTEAGGDRADDVQAAARAREQREQAVETVAWALLNRYGIISRCLLARERMAPPWRELMRVYWRLEAAGQVHGGRFISALSGEQFALPEAATALREVCRSAATAGARVATADPLNLHGIVLPGPRVPSRLGHEVPVIDSPPPPSPPSSADAADQVAEWVVITH